MGLEDKTKVYLRDVRTFGSWKVLRGVVPSLGQAHRFSSLISGVELHPRELGKPLNVLTLLFGFFNSASV